MALIIQFTGLSGAGKTTLANGLREKLTANKKRVLVIDGDEFRNKYCSDLGFSYSDRLENISRMAKFANSNKPQFDLIIISAINPFNETREILHVQCQAILIYVKCNLNTLVNRDTKGLYKRAMLANNDPLFLKNLTGVNDRFDEPTEQVLSISTSELNVSESVNLLYDFLIKLQKQLS